MKTLFFISTSEMKKAFYWFIILTFPWMLITQVKAEGTKEVWASGASQDKTRLSINDVWSDFATVDCEPNYRLYIHISNTNEKILFGFRPDGGSGFVGYTLRDPDEELVMSGNTPSSGDDGFIDTWDEAYYGPFPDDNGYEPLVSPALTKTGDYFIEFDNDFEFELFDFTVVTGEHNPALPTDAIPGRVWSQAWQFYSNFNVTPAQNFSANMYIYADDGIVTKCTFNQMKIGRFTMYCNAFGCEDTGDPEADRRSKSTTGPPYPPPYIIPLNIAQYKIFLNDPDENVYLSGTYGQLVADPQIEDDPNYGPCNNNKLIIIQVNQDGLVTITIQIPGFNDRIFENINVEQGLNEIPWDGKDGSGNLVPDGTLITIKVEYLNGLTNLPLYDIEANTIGYYVSLVRPTGPGLQTPKVYWDDSEIACANPPNCQCPWEINLTGCDPLTAGACHQWSGPNCDVKMINTWWYASSGGQATAEVVYTSIPPVPTGNNVYRCGAGEITLTVAVLPNETADWYDLPVGGTLLLEGSTEFTTSLLTTTPFYAEARSTESGCISTTRKFITANMVPFPNPPTDPIVTYYHCGPGTVTFTASVAGPNKVVDWYDALSGGNYLGRGLTYTTPAITTTTSYYAETVDYSNPAGCISLTRTEFIAEIREIPELDMTPPQPICSGEPFEVELNSTVEGSLFTWTATDDPPLSINGYTANQSTPVGGIDESSLTNQTTSDASVIYQIIPEANSCPGTPAVYSLIIHPTPHLTNEAPSPICSGSLFDVTLLSDVSGGDFTWTASCNPAGVVTGFTENQNTPVTGINEILTNTTDDPASVTYQITPHANGCDGPVTSFSVTVNPTPHLENEAPSPICSGTLFDVSLLSDVSGGDFTWTASCNPAGAVTGFTVNQNTPVTVINEMLTNTTDDPASVTYEITPHANGCDGPVTTFTVTIIPLPDVIFPSTPSNPQEICSGSVSTPVPLSSNVTGSGVAFAWYAVAFDDPTNPTSPTNEITGFTTPNGGNVIPGENITSTLLNPGVIKYYVTAAFTYDGTTCEGEEVEYTTIVNPSPTVALNPPDPAGQTICSGEYSQPITFTPNVTPISYTWSAIDIDGVDGEIPLNGTSGNIPAMNLTTTGTTQGHVKYEVTPIYQGSGTFTCPGGVSYSTIYVDALPTPTITGANEVCERVIEKYTTESSNAQNYTWELPSSGITVISGGTTDDDFVQIQWDVASVTPYEIKVNYEDNLTGCTAATPFIFEVTVQDSPDPTITGISELCQGVSATYSTEQAMSNYFWVVTGGTITSGGGSNDHTVTITWDIAGNQSVSVNYQNSDGCSALNPTMHDVTVNPLPVSTFTSTTPSPVCQDFPTPSTYTVEAGGPSATYQWQVVPPSNATITDPTSPQTDIAWHLPGNAPQTATLSLTATSFDGCITVTDQPITINPKPQMQLTSCFDMVTNRSAVPFLLKGGTPLLGEYLCDPPTSALYPDGAGNYFFAPALVPGNTTTGFNISYKYTSTLYGCIATSASIPLTVDPANPAGCSSSMTDIRDGNEYSTALFDGKCWMTENLRYGSPVTPSTLSQTDDCVAEKYCPSSDPTCIYGGFYQWNELIQYQNTEGPDYQGVCPPGWHIPTQQEWQSLIDGVAGMSGQGDGIAGGFLKDPYQANGFHAELDGLYYLNDTWAFTSDNPLLNATMFWTATPDGPDKAIARGMNNYNYSVSFYRSSKANAFPVRCVKD